MCFRRKYNITPHYFSGYQVLSTNNSEDKIVFNDIVTFLNDNPQQWVSFLKTVPGQISVTCDDCTKKDTMESGLSSFRMTKVWTLSEHFCLVTLL